MQCKVSPFVVAILFVFIVPNSEEVYSLPFSIMTKFLDAIENLVIKIPEIINNAAHLKLKNNCFRLFFTCSRLSQTLLLHLV